MASTAQKVLNSPENVCYEMLEGVVAANPGIVRLDGFPNVRLRPALPSPLGPAAAQAALPSFRWSSVIGASESLRMPSCPCPIRSCLAPTAASPGRA